MSDHHDNVPIACSLTTRELRDCETMLLAKFRSGVIEIEELQEGYSFRLAGDTEWIELISKLMMAERACCPFLTFDLTAHHNMGDVIVRMIGPAGTKEFLRAKLFSNR